MKIHLEGDAETREVHLNGKLLDPKPSQAINNHSPDGFIRPRAACPFKWRFISTLPFGEDFDRELDVPNIEEWNKPKSDDRLI